MAQVDFPLAFIVTLEHISAIEEERRFYQDGGQRLHSVLARHQRCLATDDRDKIFSSVGLVEGSSAPRALVDITYDDNVEAVYLQTATAILEADQNLDLLSRPPSTANSTLELPSWVPDWSCAPASSLTYTWGHGPLPLTGVELSPVKARFRALGGSLFASRLKSEDPKALVLDGYEFEQISEIGPIYSGIQIPTQVRSFPSVVKEWWI